jgi:signal peptidase I
MQGTTWQNEFLVDTVLMSNDDQNPETGASDWIEDVVNRALKSSYGSNEETFAEKEDQEATEAKQNLTNPTDAYVRYPYPDEDESINLHDTPEAINEEGSARSVKKAIEWLAVIVGALLVAFLIKTFLMQAYYIPSSSMTPALQVGDRVLVNKLSYEFGEVSRGDLVVFKRTEVDTGNKTDLIKRVIATEGELLEISGGEIFITEKGGKDRKLLVEPYLAEGVTTQGFVFEGLCPESEANTCLVPENFIFVMGDNRSGSRDSRYFGPVNTDDIVGRAFIRIWPLGSLKLL